MDEFYNERAARWVRDTVMKMDDDAVGPFVTMVAHGLLHEHIRDNRRTLDRRVAEIQKNLVTVAKRSPSGGVLVPVIEQVSKQYSRWEQENKPKRDKSGRFAKVESRVRTNMSKPAMKKPQERQAGIPSAKGLATATGSVRSSRKLTDQQRSAYQQQYQQIADRLDEATSRGATSIDVVLQDKRTGRRNVRTGINNLDWVDWWNPGTHDAVAVRYDAPGTDAGSATFDLVSALGGSSQTASRVAQGVSALDDQGASSFQRQWNDASRDTPGTNDRTYRRIAAGSRLVGNIPSDKARAASALGEFVGSFGPEAEKVVGPHMRRTAYRYRGTERKPDEELINLANKMAERAGMTRGSGSVGQIAADRASGASRLTPEQKINIAEQSAMLYFLGSERNGIKSRLPDNSLSELHRQSGKIPPSEGIIIDRNGEIVTQAIGYAEDHYLPFNLKNLKNLDGGAYVRTRSRGGLSTEDIYTGLMSGAREVTVVSNSGTFTIEFAPDFRGVRRYNDKAAQMVERYAKTLDAIKSGQVERDKIDAKTRAELRAEVEAQMPREMGYTEAEISAAIKEREADFRRNPQPTLAEIQEIRAKAAEAAGGNEREQRIYEAQLMEDLMEERRDRFYKLDGEGYATALRALKEQFPYYINDISFMSRRQQKKFREEPTDPRDPANEPMLRFNNAPDTGYVAPRYNRPAAVLEGYYDESITGTGKIPASQTNYQNWENNPLNRRRGPQEPQDREGGPQPQETAETPPQGLAAPQQRQTPQQQAQAALQQADQAAAYSEAMRTALSAYAGVPDEDLNLISDPGVVREARQNWESVASDPDKLSRLDKSLEEINGLFGDDDVSQKTAERAASALENARMVRTSGERAAAAGRQFDGPAYRPGAPAETVQQERARWSQVARQAGFPIPEGADPATLENFRTRAAQVSDLLQSDDPNRLSRLAELAKSMGLSRDANYALLTRAQTPEGLQALQRQMGQVTEAAARLQALSSVTPSDVPQPQEPAQVENTPQMSVEDLMGMAGQQEPEPAGMANSDPRRLTDRNLANYHASQAEQAGDDDQSAYWQDLSLALDNDQPDAEGVQMAIEGLSRFPLTAEQREMLKSVTQRYGGKRYGGN